MVKGPDEEDREKLTQLMEYLNGTKDLVLKLSADLLNILKWYGDAVIAAHADLRVALGWNGIGPGCYHANVMNTKVYHALLCCIHYEFAVYVNFLDLEYHQHLCQIQNPVLTCMKLWKIPLPLCLIW